jgi:hypothetical protein
VEVNLYVFLSTEPDGLEWSASGFGRFTPGKNAWFPFNMRLGVLHFFGHSVHHYKWRKITSEQHG